MVLEVSHFLTVPEVHQSLSTTCSAHRRRLSHANVLVAHRTCAEFYGCDPLLPPGLTWLEWIALLRQLRRWGHRDQWSVCPPQGTPSTHPGWGGRVHALHSGHVVLPPDFHFNFSAEYAHPSRSSELRRCIDVKRGEVSRELVALAGRCSADLHHAQDPGRRMVDLVVCLRSLNEERRTLETLCLRHEEGIRRRDREQRQRADIARRQQLTSAARAMLMSMRDTLATALKEASGLEPGTARSLAQSADTRMRQLPPESEMCGNDTVRCRELRQTCRDLILDLWALAEAKAASCPRKQRMTMLVRLFQQELRDIQEETVMRLKRLQETSAAALEAAAEDMQSRPENVSEDADRLGCLIERCLQDVNRWEDAGRQ